jgi:hypothetical protein
MPWRQWRINSGNQWMAISQSTEERRGQGKSLPSEKITLLLYSTYNSWLKEQLQIYLAVPSVTRKGQYNRIPDGLKRRQPVQGEPQKNQFAASLSQKSPSRPFVTFTVHILRRIRPESCFVKLWRIKTGFYLVLCNHGGTWRTMHCRLCINCYGTGSWECVCLGGWRGGCYTPPPIKGSG